MSPSHGLVSCIWYFKRTFIKFSLFPVLLSVSSQVNYSSSDDLISLNYSFCLMFVSLLAICTFWRENWSERRRLKTENFEWKTSRERERENFERERKGSKCDSLHEGWSKLQITNYKPLSRHFSLLFITNSHITTSHLYPVITILLSSSFLSVIFSSNLDPSNLNLVRLYFLHSTASWVRTEVDSLLLGTKITFYWNREWERIKKGDKIRSFRTRILVSMILTSNSLFVRFQII